MDREEWVKLDDTFFDDDDFEKVISCQKNDSTNPTSATSTRTVPLAIGHPSTTPGPTHESRKGFLKSTYAPENKPTLNTDGQASPQSKKTDVQTYPRSKQKDDQTPPRSKQKDDQASPRSDNNDCKHFIVSNITQHPLSVHGIINDDPVAYPDNMNKYNQLICTVHQYFGHAVLYQLRLRALYDLFIACIESGIQLENSKAEISLIMFYIHSSSHHHEEWSLWLNTQYNTLKSLTRRYYIAHHTHLYLDFIKWKPTLSYTPELIPRPHSPQPSTNRIQLSENTDPLNWLCCLQL